MSEIDQTSSVSSETRLVDPSGDLHLRKLRYFLAVARHLSFARAGRELFVAQPALSRAVRALEVEYGVRLLDRDPQRVSLTAAGRVLVDEGTALLARASLARRRIRAAAQEGLHLTVGFQPGVIISEIIGSFVEQHPEVNLRTHRLECDPDPTHALNGLVDVAVVRAATQRDDPAVFHLLEDPTMVAMPTSHPLAALPTLTMADLEAESLLRHAGSVDDESSGVVVRNLEEGLEAVLLKKGLAWVPASAAAYYRRSGIVYRPVSGAPRFDIVLVVEPSRLERDEAQWFLDGARDYYRDHRFELPDNSIAA